MPAPASFLYLDTLHCLQQRDLPFDADSPYLLVFAGQPGPQPEADVIRVTSPDWHQRTRSGRLHLARTWVHHDLRADSILLVALLEQDWQLDIHDAALRELRATMRQHWASCARRFAPASLPLAARLGFARQISRHLRNDALIQIRHLPVATLHGRLPALAFSGSKVRYRAGFHARRVSPGAA
ncbi:hypothetical protein ACFONG_12480 [Uliginosibacterium paludis]|uniref:DUF4123 domain-containing protein n=1 Tax=Uliginosibacterium paludis TaxID=1615952 RepID=A0ABV2CQ99_9RHOO